MGRIDRIILAIKRGETPAARAVRDVYRQVTGFELPDTAATRPLYTGLYRLHDAWQDGRELLLGKLLWEPMVRARFHHVGQGVRISGLPYIRGHAKITIGDDCRLGAFAVMSGRYVDEPELVIGKGCTLASGVFISVSKRVTIGNHTGMAGRSSIFDGDGHPTDLERRMRGESSTEADLAPVTIGDYVWIGRDAKVMKGVTIGRGAVVGAGSVVTSDVPEGALAMGVPARIVKKPW